MLAWNSKSSLGQRKRVLQVSANPKYLRSIVAERDRPGCVAAGTTDETQRGVRCFRIQAICISSAYHRIIHPHKDVPIMEQESIGHPRKLLDGLIIVPHDRLLGEIAARHDQCFKNGLIAGTFR